MSLKDETECDIELDSQIANWLRWDKNKKTRKQIEKNEWDIRRESSAPIINNIELEEGEISDSESEDIYIPLQRPPPSSTALKNALTNGTKVANPETIDGFNSNTDSNSSSSSDDSESEMGIFYTENKTKAHKHKIKKILKRTVMVRINAEDQQEKKTKFRKYNIWTKALQEDALTEDMRGCDVTHNKLHDRNVENYDFLKYRVKSESTFKRQHSAESDEEFYQVAKKRRSCDKWTEKQSQNYHQNNKKRSNSFPRNDLDSLENVYQPRYIQDLSNIDEKDHLSIAKEMAEKLYEKKDELLVRIVDVLGLKIPLEIYEETQRIEADGGMNIINGERRRTPGGVFLFLLKNHDKISVEQQKAIFDTDKKNTHKKRRGIEKSRNRKVEELKKRLGAKDSDIISLNSRNGHSLISDKRNDCNSSNISNPPPSPVAADQNTDSKSLKSNCTTSDYVDFIEGGYEESQNIISTNQAHEINSSDDTDMGFP